jgi:glycosyltransferase involved in cell wall biosynthesis
MRVIVLMSTFNGERFIDEQVRSILDHLPSGGLLMVRDDGSSDGTVSRIQAFNDSRIQLLRGENIGFAHSFLTLLTLTPPDTDLVMFSDQDDVWMDGKIQRAWQYLQALQNQPALYCSAQMLVNESLVKLHPTPPWPHPPSFNNALVENVVTGCTAALNQRAVALLQSAGVPESVHFHDWWMYLVVSAFGTVVLDDEPTVLYRQHGTNQIGRGSGWWGRQIQMVKFLLRHDWVGILLGQVTALKVHYGPRLGDNELSLLAQFFDIDRRHLRIRWSVIFSLLRLRQRLHHEVPFRLLAALHRLRL